MRLRRQRELAAQGRQRPAVAGCGSPAGLGRVPHGFDQFRQPAPLVMAAAPGGNLQPLAHPADLVPEPFNPLRCPQPILAPNIKENAPDVICFTKRFHAWR